jgi:general secretion pathway protein N
MMRKRMIGFVVLALSICGSGSVSLSAISTLALDDPADGVRPESPAAPSLIEPPAAAVQATAPPPAPAVPAAERVLSANPLWAMPLAQFPVTRERPIFSPSRRPLAAAIAPAMIPRVVAMSKPKEQERPQLSLVGTIVGDDEGFGIFLDQSTKAVIRLKVGENFQGWKLRTVQGRETALEKDEQVVTLVLPQPGLGQVSTEGSPPPPPPPSTQSPPSSPAAHRTRSTAPEPRPVR